MHEPKDLAQIEHRRACPWGLPLGLIAKNQLVGRTRGECQRGIEAIEPKAMPSTTKHVRKILHTLQVKLNLD